MSELKQLEIHDDEPIETTLKIIKPIQPVSNFDSPEDFLQFYKENPKLFEDKTTCALNKMFKIEGYRITKIKGEIMVKNIPKSKVTHEDRISRLEASVEQIIETVNSVVEHLQRRS